MVILGIDPGIARTGFGVISAESDDIKVLDYGCIKTPSAEVKPVRLCAIFEQVSALIEKYRPEVLSLELLFFNRNTKTALTVGEARGVIMLCAGRLGVPVAEYTPLQVKDCLTGFGRAKKDEIRELLESDLGIDLSRVPIDASDALAIAICHNYHSDMED